MGSKLRIPFFFAYTLRSNTHIFKYLTAYFSRKIGLNNPSKPAYLVSKGQFYIKYDNKYLFIVVF